MVAWFLRNRGIAVNVYLAVDIAVVEMGLGLDAQVPHRRITIH
jgi:hypothetical protein